MCSRQRPSRQGCRLHVSDAYRLRIRLNPEGSRWLSVSDTTRPFLAPRKHPTGMPDTGRLSLADLRDAGGGQALGILHPSEMQGFAGTGPVVSLTLNHRLEVMMPPASDDSA